EEDVEVVAPRGPRPAGPEKRVIEVMEAPKQKRSSQERRASRRHAQTVRHEDPSGPERREAEKGDRWAGRPVERIDPVDGDVRPDRGKEHQGQVGPAPSWPVREDEGRGQQSQRGPAGDHLMPVEPSPLLGGDEADDRREPQQVQRPGDAPPGEVGLAVSLEEKRAERSERGGDGGLEEGGRELGVAGERGRGVHGTNKGLWMRWRNGQRLGGRTERRVIATVVSIKTTSRIS